MMEQLDEIEQSIIGLLDEVEAIRRRSRSGVRCFAELLDSDSWQPFVDWMVFSVGISLAGVEMIRVSTKGTELYKAGGTLLISWILWKGNLTNDDRAQV